MPLRIRTPSFAVMCGVSPIAERTMEAADYLCGVTMQPGGSSRVVSETVKG
jgi:hypothetical protein